MTLPRPDETIAWQAEGTLVAFCPRHAYLHVSAPHRVLSFAPHRGGYADARTVMIGSVRNADLPLGYDPLPRLAAHVAELDEGGVGMLTSRSLNAVDVASVAFEGGEALALATVGLSNAVAVGDTPGPLRGWGTINLVVRVSIPLGDTALAEALSIVAEARTRAVIEANVLSRRSDQIATGTGTDCIAVLAPLGSEPAIYAGKHTALGHGIGAATLAALRAGITRWKREVEP